MNRINLEQGSQSFTGSVTFVNSRTVRFIPTRLNDEFQEEILRVEVSIQTQSSDPEPSAAR